MGRDLAVDLVRVCCVLLVVVLHSLMVGLGTRADGSVVLTNPLQAQAWFAPASWLGQIMPLFFVVGGFASWQGWRSGQRRGGGDAEFFRTRLIRLVRPAAAWYVPLRARVWAAVALGAPVPVVQMLAGGLGMPLWFLAAYLICQALVPLLGRAHLAHRYRTVALLLVGCVAVDVVRYATGHTAVGLVNLLLVWPLAQQLGFFYADGSLQRIPRVLLPVIALVALTGVGLAGELGPWSPDMLNDLNPPTSPLVLIGVAQTALFLLVKPLLDALMRRRAAQAFVFLVGSRIMTVYLWHLLVVVLAAALVLVLPGVLPAAGTAAWWWTRIPSDLVVFGVILALTVALVRFERGPAPERIGRTPSLPMLAAVAVLAIAPPFVAMQFRLDLAGFAWGAVAMLVAVRIALGRRSGSSGLAAQRRQVPATTQQAGLR